VGTDYILEKLPDVSGPGLVEAGRYTFFVCTVIGLSILSGHIYPCIIGLVDLCWQSMTQTEGEAKLLIFVYSSYNYYQKIGINQPRE